MKGTGQRTFLRKIEHPAAAGVRDFLEEHDRWLRNRRPPTKTTSTDKKKLPAKAAAIATASPLSLVEGEPRPGSSAQRYAQLLVRGWDRRGHAAGPPRLPPMPVPAVYKAPGGGPSASGSSANGKKDASQSPPKLVAGLQRSLGDFIGLHVGGTFSGTVAVKPGPRALLTENSQAPPPQQNKEELMMGEYDLDEAYEQLDVGSRPKEDESSNEYSVSDSSLSGNTFPQQHGHGLPRQSDAPAANRIGAPQEHYRTMSPPVSQHHQKSSSVERRRALELEEALQLLTSDEQADRQLLYQQRDATVSHLRRRLEFAWAAEVEALKESEEQMRLAVFHQHLALSLKAHRGLRSALAACAPASPRQDLVSNPPKAQTERSGAQSNASEAACDEATLAPESDVEKKSTVSADGRAPVLERPGDVMVHTEVSRRQVLTKERAKVSEEDAERRGFGEAELRAPSQEATAAADCHLEGPSSSAPGAESPPVPSNSETVFCSSTESRRSRSVGSTSLSSADDCCKVLECNEEQRRVFVVASEAQCRWSLRHLEGLLRAQLSANDEDSDSNFPCVPPPADCTAALQHEVEPIQRAWIALDERRKRFDISCAEHLMSGTRRRCSSVDDENDEDEDDDGDSDGMRLNGAPKSSTGLASTSMTVVSESVQRAFLELEEKNRRLVLVSITEPFSSDDEESDSEVAADVPIPGQSEQTKDDEPATSCFVLEQRESVRRNWLASQADFERRTILSEYESQV